VLSVTIIVLAATSTGAIAQKRYDTGATGTEIKIGNIMPYSGPASSYGVIGKTDAAYFRKINAAGGIDGRKINFISYDDAYSPPKAVEQARKLVESDEVLNALRIGGHGVCTHCRRDEDKDLFILVTFANSQWRRMPMPSGPIPRRLDLTQPHRVTAVIYAAA
jgi:hypothetical protein